MIKLFISDIDGCLAEPYQPWDLGGFETLARYAREADALEQGGPRPVVSLCSGRAYAYVEAVAQALALTTPVLFESGAGLFYPAEARTAWNPAFTDEVEAQLNEVREWMLETCVPGTSLALDHNKRTQAGVVSPDTAEIERFIPDVEAFVDKHAPDLHVFPTHVSIDVVPPAITKRDGLEWLGWQLGVPLSAMAYIGDTKGDLVALERVGQSFAPANAQALVRERVNHVTESPLIDGTLEAYRWCVHHNKTQPSETS